MIRAGSLLIATPVLDDPNFVRTVVLLVESDAESGALGVVLNRPAEVPVAQVLPSWGSVVSHPQVVFQGGPVQTDSALALASVTGGAEPLGWRPIDGTAAALPGPGRVGIIDLDTPPEIIADEIASMRVFAGYAGWGAEQLEGEIKDGAWYVVPADPADAFSADPERLWRDILRRQTGELAFVATFPEDPTLN